MKGTKVLAAVLAVAGMSFGTTAQARESESCSGAVTRSDVVRCALAASLVVRGEEQGLDAARARKTAASPLLPSNPVLSFSAARRSVAEANATNWYASLNQEVEIAGQRGVRREAAEAAASAQSQRVLLSRRETAALASAAFFEALAAREEQRLAEQLVVTSEAVATAARARAERGLSAAIDADVADAATVRVLQARLAAERRVSHAGATLALLLGLDPSRPAPAVEGDLAPLPEVVNAGSVVSPRARSERPELRVVEAERRSLELRAAALRRARIPNPTLSIYAQNDGFDERVLGAGIGFPIPLPGNVGRTARGEIAEAEAQAARTGTDRERLEREIRFEVTTARQAFESRGTEVLAFTAERLERARTSLRSLSEEVQSGRLAVRDAAVAQQVLIELLRASIEARRAWCLASVDLARALGLPLERGAR